MSTPLAAVPLATRTRKSHVPSTRRVTLRDVAERAGVKEACVSVVINGARSNAHVSPVARERILQASEELGYKRNSSMASMAKGRFGCVALLLSTNPGVSVLPSPVWEGIHDELARQDIHLSLFRLPDEKLSNKKILPKIMREWMADGMLIDYTHNIPADLIALIDDHALPAIWINSKQEFDCVRPDDFKAAVAATEKLIQLGHKHISYVHLYRFLDEALDHYSAHDRYEGYIQAMTTAGLTPQAFFAKDTPRTEHARLIQELVCRDEASPTAFVTYGDESEAIFWVAARLGLKVPYDLSIISLSDGGSAGLWSGIQLTTFRVPEYEIGQRAAAMIQQKIITPHQKLPSEVVTFTFTEGDSIAPPQPIE